MTINLPDSVMTLLQSKAVELGVSAESLAEKVLGEVLPTLNFQITPNTDFINDLADSIRENRELIRRLS